MAQLLAARARSDSLDRSEYLIALHYATFWINELPKLEPLRSRIEKAEFLFRTYADFLHRYVPAHDIHDEEILFPLRSFLFHLALGYLEEETSHPDDRAAERASLLMTIRSYKMIGDYRKALAILEMNFSDTAPDDAECLAEFADIFDLISEQDKARLLFRDAFYSGPQAVALDFLLSPMIARIRRQLASFGLTPPALHEWFGVYGVLMGYFNVRRKLSPFEVSRLKQEITNLRLEWSQNRHSESPVVPRLIYRYFLLLDHYKQIKEDRSKWDEILLSLKMIDPQIYAMYTKI